VKPIENLDYGLDTTRVETIAIKNGGDAMNTAVALAKLGNRVSFAGRVGCDAMGSYLRGVMEGLSIDASGLTEDSVTSTSTCLALVNRAAERAFFYYGGANDRFTAADVPQRLLTGASVVHVGGTFLLPGFDGDGAAELFMAAHRQGCITSMDVTFDASGRWMDIIRPCLGHIDIFMPSINEASRITGTDDLAGIALVLKAAGVKNVIVKLGAKGCYVNAGGEEFVAPAYDVPVVDTTGAGDCFAAGFLTGLVKNLPYRQCAAIGCAAAADCVGALGATDGVRPYAEVLQRIHCLHTLN
jgi:sugar/nucleoside kinase (ribokinase family)